jgi:predicted helicase
MIVYQYIEQIQRLYKTGLSSEHSYRGDLRTLLESIASGVMVTNEPKRIACGAPDYIITRNDIPVGYIEAKDIGKDIGHKDYKEQFDRYRKSLNNLIITDYLDFWLYIDGELKAKIQIAKIVDSDIISMPENFEAFNALIRSFCAHVGQTIKSSQKLATMMADKAKLLSQIIEKALHSDVENEENSTLKDQMQAFKDILIHDITPREFADIYAQTIAYGMFAARLHDPTLNTFSRQEAAELIPKTNPFLRKLFQYIAAIDLDSRIAWIVDALADIFRATDVAALLQNFGKATQMNDPIIHFYETFLSEYDPHLRKTRGVWYTPEPIVNFIVRAVDDILKTEFNLPSGLADNAKIKVTRNTQNEDARTTTGYRKTEVEIHKVQILDPATGTGTFLAEVVKHIYKKYKGQQGIWSSYVENHLIPRLNGFELLMASYAMAHLKLDILLAETGYKPTREQRFKIYLTNSLEEHHPDTSTLFANWLSSEANDANHIKRDTPVMVVMGNPPYSGESANKGNWIMKLMEDYKKEPGGKEKLKERNPKWINDDYVKFLRYGQHFIEKNGEGILAFINPHGFLDNPTFRGMRWNLLKTFDKIYTIDLHGNSKKNEISPDGSPDVNVFDIMQGVSINLFIKTSKKKPADLAQVYHYDLFGKREFKYMFLWEHSLQTVKYDLVNPSQPNYFFTGKNFGEEQEYNYGFAVNELFNKMLLGPNSHRDDFAISFNAFVANQKINDLRNEHNSEEFLRKKYDLVDNRDWKFTQKRKLVTNKDLPVECIYRPFDFRYMLYGEYAFDYHRPQINDELLHKNNFGFITTRQTKESFSVFITNKPLGQHKIATPYDGSYVSPLYLYSENGGQLAINQNDERIPNLDLKIVQQIATGIGLTFTNEKETATGVFAPIDLLDYIYATLYSPAYRKKYKEFLKIDFPRVPYPTDVLKFWKLVKLGGQLRQLHLLKSATIDNFITSYPEDGDNVISTIYYDKGKVYINQVQYFDNVPANIWQFYIGGYQPAQKWLKDRKGSELSFDDILHYQRLIVALNGTNEAMEDIDKIEI